MSRGVTSAIRKTQKPFGLIFNYSKKILTEKTIAQTNHLTDKKNKNP